MLLRKLDSNNRRNKLYRAFREQGQESLHQVFENEPPHPHQGVECTSSN